MRHYDKRLIFCLIFFLGLLCVLLTWPAAPVNAATKAPVFAGFQYVALYPDLAEDMGLSREQQGLVVMGVCQGSPAEKAGFHEGDLIIKVQAVKGKAVTIKDSKTYDAAVNAIPAAKPIIFTVLQKDQGLPVQLIRSSDKLGLLIQPPPAAAPQTIKVSSDGTGDCKSIDGALLRSRPGDTILIKPGKYSSTIVQRNNLTLTAFDQQNPPVLTGVSFAYVTGAKIKDLIISPENPAQLVAVNPGIRIDSANQITIANCQIRSFNYGIAIYSNASTVIILDANIITGNWAGIYMQDPASDVKISHNLICKNYGVGGIYVDGLVQIINNTIIENRVSNDNFNNQLYSSKGKTVLGAGITIRGGNAMIYNNIIAFNNVGCLVSPFAQATLEYNDVFQHLIDSKVWYQGGNIQIKGGNSNYLSEINYEYKMAPLLSLVESDKTTITPVLKFEPSTTNINSNPFFVDSSKGDYRLANDSPLIEKGRGKSYIGAFPPIVPKQGVETGNKQPVFGISARPLTDLDRKTLGLASLGGLWVTEVKKSSLADKLQIKVDDVILEINNTVFKDNEEFKKIITTTTITTVKVFRGGTEIVLTVPTEF